MSHTTTLSPVDGAPPQPRGYQVAREQTRQRAQRYKSGLTLTAFLGFGMLGIIIGYPKLVSTTSTTNSQSTKSTQSTQSTFFNQQGGNVNGSSTSQQQPSTSSSAS
jgi:hypothetical protein